MNAAMPQKQSSKEILNSLKQIKVEFLQRLDNLRSQQRQIMKNFYEVKDSESLKKLRKQILSKFYE